MQLPTLVRFKTVFSIGLICALGACALPKSGPGRDGILENISAAPGSSAFVLVDPEVARLTQRPPASGFGPFFQKAMIVGPDTLSSGDTLGLTIYENVNDGLLASQGQRTSALTQVQVDGEGMIFVPYAGRIKAAGETPDGLRALITEKLLPQTPDPQVQVVRLACNGATVSILGKVGGQGVYPIEQPTRRLSAMLAKAGGVAVEPEVALVTVQRGDQSGTVWFNDITHNPKNDIALRPGDRIMVEQDTRAFIALGATGSQSRVAFSKQDLSALDALAVVGGLNSSLADPTGVFVLRKEQPKIANSILNRTDITADQRVIYGLNLSGADGLFLAREFIIHDGDTIYVTEAPFVQLQKTLSAIAGPLNTVASVDRLANR